MDHVLWIGGPPCAGKTTVATRLARRHGLRLYSADTRTWDHLDRAIAAGVSTAIEWEAMTPAERWERSSPEQMLAHCFLTERGQMVLDDLDGLPTSPLVVAEGTTLPAKAVASGVAQRQMALWMIPTAGFQDAQLEATRVSPGHRILYRLMRDVIADQASESGAPTLSVDGDRDAETILRLVEEHFADALARGSHASSVDERANLAREANLAMISNVLGYFGRPWATGDPEALELSFSCECGDRECTTELRRSVAEAASSPLLAGGH